MNVAHYRSVPNKRFNPTCAAARVWYIMSPVGTRGLTWALGGNANTMGFRVLLVAVSGKSPDALWADYGVAPTGQFSDVPDSPVNGALLHSGRYLLFINDHILPEDHLLRKLSRNAQLIACYGNETVMNSIASSWTNGVEDWFVFHDAQQGIRHLETTGTLPEFFASIRNGIVSEQDAAGDNCGIDYIYDIPIEVFAALGGHRYNESIRDSPGQPWQALKRISKAKSWWQS